jgi:hypothetical protein
VISQLMRPTTPRRRKRFRGKKRYFRRVQRDAESFELDLRTDSWWNLWHYHADWKGWGNLGWRYRRQHIQALARVFTTIASHADAFAMPFQSWIFLSGRDAGGDATYLRTSRLLKLFEELIPNLPLRVGEVRLIDDSAGSDCKVADYFVFSPQVGVPLDSAIPSNR